MTPARPLEPRRALPTLAPCGISGWADLLVPTVLVTGAPGAPELAATRSLWRDGDVCDLLWPRREGERAWSRSVRAWHGSRDAYSDPRGFVEDLASILRHAHYDVVLPYGLPACFAAVHHRAVFEGLAATLLPPLESFRRANDKAATAALCEDLGIAVPRTYAPGTLNDVRAVARDALFPVIVKPRSGSATGLKVVQRPGELLAAYEGLTERAPRGAAEDFATPLIQEFIPGHLHDGCTVWKEGQPLAVLTQVRQVMVPVYGGVGAVNVTTDNPTVRALSVKVLDALQWSGPAQVEFRHDPRTGTYHLIEINPKFWGTLALSAHAGLSFPALARDAALGRLPQGPVRYRVGVRKRFTYPRAREAALQLAALLGNGPSDPPGAFAETHGDIDWKDPIPDLLRAWRWGRSRGQIRAAAAALDPELAPLVTPPQTPWEGMGEGWAWAF